ncbi:MAG: S41 family peptidase [Planctomycetota bacterium]|nr:S41 family peptidase [Planctomycetota bacterium]
MSEKSLKILLVGLALCLVCYLNAARYRPTRDVAYAIEIISDSYVDPISQADLKQAAMQGMLESLDPHSSFVSEDSLGRFNAVFEQRFAGLGVQVEGPPIRPQITIITTLFNSPAFRAGLMPGDLIVQVDGADVRSMETSEVSKKIAGAVGSQVLLGIDRAGERLNIQATREFVDVESITGDRRKADGTWDFQLQTAPQIAYIHADLFGEKTANEIQSALESLRGKIDAIILDLRDNGGGLLQAAIEVCDLFLDDGRIVSTQGRRRSSFDAIDAKAGTVVPNSVPIAVLINSNSASASEVVAACLKDRHRAVIVGQRSYGKGSVQSIIPVEGGRAAIRFTTAYYFPPSGQRIHRRPKDTDSDPWGVLPSDGAEVLLSEEQTRQAIERMRRRSDPLRNGALGNHPLSKIDDPDDQQIAQDSQLVRAIEILQALRSESSKPKGR